MHGSPLTMRRRLKYYHITLKFLLRNKAILLWAKQDQAARRYSAPIKALA
jgi:hypothetical protein